MKPCQIFFIVILLKLFQPATLIAQDKLLPREHLSLDTGWRFAFGHPYDVKKDYENGTGYFSYLAKTGYGDGAAAPGFDDRSWRKLDLPHDWAAELGFDQRASLSHGFKAIGRNFPDASLGWYRKTIQVPSTDLGRKISIAFDGVFRNSIVWVNGHYLGTEPSGYQGFEYDITDYLNYGGENTIAVRVDATMEEGWFYEGAGIYRHVWLNKTEPLHIVSDGTFVRSIVKGDHASVTASVRIKNDALKPGTFSVQQNIIDATGHTIASGTLQELNLNALEEKEFTLEIPVIQPRLWDLDDPYLYQLKTIVTQNGKKTDQYETAFGIRTIRFDANEGFFLNGKRVELKGTNNHQDHAGVGAAVPDALQYYRISKLKEMGSNAYRCSHNPPTPELLDACDKLGMLVIDENRLMSITEQNLSYLKKLIIRDRNHPGIISWSIGNEEWGIEGNIVGARIAATMQAYAKTIDTTRPITAAISGGVGYGISTTIDLLGYNYVATKNTDEQHRKFPWQTSWGTEEGSTVTSRGIYVDDLQKHELAAYDKKQNDNFLSLEDGWKYYAARPYLAGMFIWTGFDYRGEPTPFGWPSVLSYFGMLDLCGFPKDNVWYLRSWWTDQPTLHLLPHWNWKGREGQPVEVRAYSNCDEVELFLNKKSQGKKRMEPNGHLSWQVNYVPGVLEAIGYKNGKKILSDIVRTTGQSLSVGLTQDSIPFDKSTIAVVTVDTRDQRGYRVPTATDEISFDISGPARIIGVGNGNPTSLEKDRYLEQIELVNIGQLKEKTIADLTDIRDVTLETNDNGWRKAFTDERTQAFGDKVKALVYRGSFTLPQWEERTKISFFYKSIGKEQSIYINGKEIARNLPANNKGNAFILDRSVVQPGVNTIAIVATPLLKKNSWDVINMDPGLFQLLKPADTWKRKLFSGLAQVIVELTGGEGDVILSATSGDLKTATLKIKK